MAEFSHSMKLVTRRTGLSPHVIRVWERRYAAVTPVRTGSNRRRYTESEVERLELLGRLTSTGHSIGTIASLSTEQLRALAAAGVQQPAEPGGEAVARRSARSVDTAGGMLEAGIEAIKAMDGRALEEVLTRASIVLGAQGILCRLIAPLAQAVGNLWRDGTLTAAHEHFASAAIRTFLGQATRPFAESAGMPGIVVGTPSGQLHELGALLAGAAAANLGWRVTYLGPSLPAPEIAGAVAQNRAQAIALSLVYPEDDPNVVREITQLRRLIPPSVALLVGGRAAAAYRSALEGAGVMIMSNLEELSSKLDVLRRLPEGAR